MGIINQNVISDKIIFLPKFIIRALLIFFGFYSTFSGEITDIFDGCGTDGFIYSYFTYDLENRVKKKDFPYPLYARILPLAGVHYGARYIAGSSYKIDKTFDLGEYKIPFSKSLFDGFRLYNLFVFIVSIYISHLISKELKLTTKGDVMLLGFLFFNFCNLKQYFYEPVMLDPSIFLHGLALFYVFILRNHLLLIVITILGFFINEANAIIALILCGFSLSSNYEQNNMFNTLNLTWLKAIGAIVYSSSAIYLFYVPFCLYSDENPTIGYLLPLSIPITILFLYYTSTLSLSFLIKANLLKDLWKQFMGWQFITLLFLLITIRLLSYQISDKLAYPICDDKDMSILTYLLNIVRLSSSRPGGFLVAHFLYLGPIIILCFIFCREILTFLARYGYGILIAMGIMLFNFINTESRQCILGFIFLVIPLANIFENKISWLTVLIILGSLILISRLYLPLNPLSTDLYAQAIKNNSTLLFKQPLQKYMMNLGPWMSDKNYLIWLFPTLVTMIGGWWLKQKKIKFC